MACRYHVNAQVIGQCVDCGKDYCADCLVEVKRHGNLCLDCGAKFARKKLNQSYIALVLGAIVGLAMISKAGVLGVIVYPYMFLAVFWGWHLAQRFWIKSSSWSIGSLPYSVFMLSMRFMYALIVGSLGGAIIQFKRHWDIAKKQQQLAVQLQTA